MKEKEKQFGATKEQVESLVNHVTQEHEKEGCKGKKIKTLVLRVNPHTDNPEYIKFKYVVAGKVIKKMFYFEKSDYQDILDWLDVAV